MGFAVSLACSMRNTGTRTAVRLKDYTPPPYLIDAVRLGFALGRETTEVSAEVELRRNPASRETADSLTLDGEELELLEIAIDGRAPAEDRYRADPDGLTIEAPPERFTLATRTRIHPQANTALSGLYTSSGNFCTQCEAEGFRRITYYLDRPDVLARFTTRIEADKAEFPTLLSNGNLVETGELEAGRHYALWRDPYPKPAYLFALVAGRLSCCEDVHTSVSGRAIPLRLYVEEHNAERTAHAMAALKRAMRWDEQRYGREYDLDTFMIVAVDDFNMGAMENKGLNIFNSKYILADPQTATDQDYAAIEAVVGHEYFHNWTGNRVTLRDWFQLSLKEGLTVFREQSFAAEMTSPVLQRVHDVRFLHQFQFPEDAGPMAHPVRPDRYLEINNFYTATVYEKGAEVVRMYRTLLGADGFRRGMDLYFERHDGQAVTTDDFLAAMADANGADLTQFARWYQVAGTPRLQARGHYDPRAHAYTLTLRQVHADSPGQPAADKPPLLIPVSVALLASDGSELPLALAGETGEPTERVLWLREFEQSFRFENVPEHPVPSLLRNFSAPVRLEFPYGDAELAFLVAHDDDLFNRWSAGQKLVVRTVKSRIAGDGADSPPQLLIDAFAALLRDTELDPALVAETLSLPGESQLAQEFERVDVDALHRTRRGLKRDLAAGLAKELEAVLERTRAEGPYRYAPGAAGRRRLHGVALDYLAARGGAHLALAATGFAQADNMTDRLAALAALLAHDAPESREALQRYRADFDGEPLALDKWFALQATAPLPNALARVRGLMDDPAFTLRNPNRVRALIGSFAHANHAGFHAADGGGYRFVADQVLALDALNPQVAARLVTCFAHWRRYDETRRSLIRAQLERIGAAPTLSRDVYEIVERSLA